ncbi:MAG: hypothetical protein R3194_07810 [Limnobacter sp.]|nr:hypothetical protein [Limnobacter sp.]
MTTRTHIQELVSFHEKWLGKPYSECSQAELLLVLDNLESELSPECLSDWAKQHEAPIELRQKAIRTLWANIEARYGVHKPLSHKW